VSLALLMLCTANHCAGQVYPWWKKIFGYVNLLGILAILGPMPVYTASELLLLIPVQGILTVLNTSESWVEEGFTVIAVMGADWAMALHSLEEELVSENLHIFVVYSLLFVGMDFYAYTLTKKMLRDSFLNEEVAVRQVS
jgi:hypothetical protein